MERRDNRRFARRIEIRFWRKADTQGHTAFTTNLSRTGLFLGTAMGLMPGERLRLEIVDPDHGFFVEGQVARVHRVSLALRQVAQAGVGVRFLLPDELIENLLPANAREAPATRLRTAPSPEFAARGPARGDSAPVPTSAAAGDVEAGAPPTGKIVPVSFSDASAFLSVYHRDIQFGGLFVSTEAPGELNEVVWVELQLPLEDTRAMPFAARIVQRFEPEAAVGGGRNILAGMALQFLEPEKIVADLKPLLPRLRS
jgi:Tfp pilus assembly protein PilZ